MRTLHSSLLRSVSRAKPINAPNTGSIIRLSSRCLSSSPPIIDPVALRATMVSRPAKHLYDTLSPTHSRLLISSLSDFLPPACFPDLPPHEVNSTWDSEPLPQGHHLLYFPLDLPPSLLHPDGTDPAHSPPKALGFTRRMWAGGSVKFHRPRDGDLCLDDGKAVCEETIGDVRVKSTGDVDKVFVDVQRQYGYINDGEKEPFAWGQPAIEETRSLVFMKPFDHAGAGASPGTPLDKRVVKAPHAPDACVTLTPTPTLLFHFSALTYNAHAIHLDPQYSREVEGHRGLLVHGPLSLVLMMSFLRSQINKDREDQISKGRYSLDLFERRSVLPEKFVKEISYRNLVPLYAGETLKVCVRKHPMQNDTLAGEKWDVWIEGRDGGLAVKGLAIVEDERITKQEALEEDD